jgi:hypothetical protein
MTKWESIDLPEFNAVGDHIAKIADDLAFYKPWNSIFMFLENALTESLRNTIWTISRG